MKDPIRDWERRHLKKKFRELRKARRIYATN